MNSTSSSPVIFSRWVSWLGVLMLGAGVSSASLSPSQAASPALSSASLQFSATDIAQGVLEGGTPVSYETGVEGWTREAFASLGLFGLEWDSLEGDTRRMTYSGSTESSSLIPGGTSTWITAGNVASSPRDSIFLRETLEVSGNTARFTLALEPIDGDVMEDKRLYWKAGLPPGYQSEFTGAGSSTLVVSDGSHAHPTLVLHATTGAGTATWGGPAIYTDALTNGEPSPTLYIHSTSEEEFTIVITVGIVDRDPCSAVAAASSAHSKAGSFGEGWSAHTSCLQAPNWSIPAEGETETVNLETGINLGGLPEGHTTDITVSGLPSGVTAVRGSDSGTRASFSLTASREVAPGSYSPVITRETQVNSSGVVTVSQRDSVTSTLVVTEGAPLPEAEEEAPVAKPPAPADTEPAENRPQPLLAPTVEPAPVAPSPRPSPLVIDPLPEVPEPPVLSDEPPAPRGERDPAFFIPLEPEIPQATNASAWLGLSLAVVMLAGGLIAAFRRRLASRGTTDNAWG